MPKDFPLASLGQIGFNLDTLDDIASSFDVAALPTIELRLSSFFSSGHKDAAMRYENAMRTLSPSIRTQMHRLHAQRRLVLLYPKYWGDDIYDWEWEVWDSWLEVEDVSTSSSPAGVTNDAGDVEQTSNAGEVSGRRRWEHG